MTEAQKAYLKKILPGRRVDDIGCGHRDRLGFLRTKVDYLGFDKEQVKGPHRLQKDLSLPCQELRHDVAFIAWPINRKGIGWDLFLQKYQDIIYLGANHSCTVCGDKRFWEIIQNQKVINIIPDERETLIHYVTTPRSRKAKTPQEEAWGISVWEGKPPAIYNPKKFTCS